MKKGCLILIGMVIGLVVVTTLCTRPSSNRTSVPVARSQPSAEPGRVMYFCGYDRCTESLEYGVIWEGPEAVGWTMPITAIGL